MLTLRSITWIFVILLSIQLKYGKGAINKSQGSQHFEEGFLYMGKNSFHQGNLVFAICDVHSRTTMKCNLVQKVYPNKVAAHTCNITVQADHDDSDLDVGEMGVATLGKDKVILYWGEDYNSSRTAKIATVNLETCKVNEVKILDPKKTILMELFGTDKLVTYDDDSFDIFINDPKQFGGKLGKMEINGDGTAKGEPIASNIRTGLVYYLAPIATRSSSKGYASLRKDDTDFELSLTKSDGSEKKLEKYAEIARPIVSASENVVSACSKANADSDVTCKQYDKDGNVKFTTIITDPNKNTQALAVYNLPAGGMLVLLVESKQCNQRSDCNNDSKFRMIKISSDGKIEATARIEEFDSFSSQHKTSYVYKFDDSKYCAAIFGVNPTTDNRKPSDYEIIHHCVTLDEFSA